MLKKTIRLFDSAFNRIAAVLCLLLFLVCLYAMIDAVNVYLNANDTSVLKYKPELGHGKEALQELSEDAVAWLTVDNTKIDYPVMQGSDNIKYLNTDPFGSYALSGSIFLDSRNSSDMSDDYSVVYGHHMEHGRMFGALDDFLDRSYLEKHTSGSLIVGSDAEVTYPLEVFASMKAKATDESIFEFKCSDIRDYIRSNSEVFLTDDDKPIIALSTCSSGDMVARTIVFCYIIK